MKYLFVLLLAVSCTDESSECLPIQQRCIELQRLMNQSTGAEKEQYEQKYLAEKHLLENCQSQ